MKRTLVRNQVESKFRTLFETKSLFTALNSNILSLVGRILVCWMWPTSAILSILSDRIEIIDENVRFFQKHRQRQCYTVFACVFGSFSQDEFKTIKMVQLIGPYLNVDLFVLDVILTNIQCFCFLFTIVCVIWNVQHTMSA